MSRLESLGKRAAKDHKWRARGLSSACRSAAQDWIRAASRYFRNGPAHEIGVWTWAVLDPVPEIPVYGITLVALVSWQAAALRKRTRISA